MNISGTATADDGTTYRDVALGFTQGGCADCDVTTATTDAAGSYTARLAPGAYDVACLATPFTCTFADSGTSTTSLDASVDTTLDVTIAGAEPPPDPPSAGALLSGHVLTNGGQPVPGVTIDLRPPYGNPTTTTTAEDGSYAFDASNATIGVYTVVCSVANPDYECGPVGGDGTGPTVNLADPPQVIEFVLCHSEDFPACLSR